MSGLLGLRWLVVTWWVSRCFASDSENGSDELFSDDSRWNFLYDSDQSYKKHDLVYDSDRQDRSHFGYDPVYDSDRPRHELEAEYTDLLVSSFGVARDSLVGQK